MKTLETVLSQLSNLYEFNKKLKSCTLQSLSRIRTENHPRPIMTIRPPLYPGTSLSSSHMNQIIPVFLSAVAANTPPIAPPTAWITLGRISATAPCRPMLGISVSPMK